MIDPVIEALRRLDTCAVANAIETFHVQLRNQGYCDASIRCQFPDLSPMVGHAVTAKIRSATPPQDASRFRYADRTDWWDFIVTVPEPRIVVMEDVGPSQGRGSAVGEVHAAILKALGCVGFVSNGAVRDLEGVRAMGFHLFSGSVTPSHAYAHIVAIGADATVGGLRVRTGDLLHGDRHGVVSIPAEIAQEIPSVAETLSRHEARLLALCRSKEFTIEKLRAAVREG